MRCLLLAFFVLIILPLESQAASLQTVTGTNLRTVYAVPPPQAGFGFSQFYYDIHHKLLYAEFTGVNAYQILQINLRTRAQNWLPPNTWPATINDIRDRGLLPVPPYGRAMLLGSQIQRITGPDHIEQPFGDYKSELSFRETAFTTSAPEAGGMIDMGRGVISFRIRNQDRDIVFEMTSSYENNSDNIPFFWSPDGQYVFSVWMENGKSIMSVIGPFPVKFDEATIFSNVSWDPDLWHEAEKNRRFSHQEIDAWDRYGREYTETAREIQTCATIRAITGDLTLDPVLRPADILQTGIEKASGYFFRYGFNSDTGKSGILEIFTPGDNLEPRFRPGFKRLHKAIKIIMPDQITYAVCLPEKKRMIKSNG